MRDCSREKSEQGREARGGITLSSKNAWKQVEEAPAVTVLREPPLAVQNAEPNRNRKNIS